MLIERAGLIAMLVFALLLLFTVLCFHEELRQEPMPGPKPVALPEEKWDRDTIWLMGEQHFKNYGEE